MARENSFVLSYSRADLGIAEELENALTALGFGVWRDQRALYAGDRWPKRLGEAVAAQDALVLVWSKSAAASEFVELEWCTGLALGKPVLPYLVDETPLPAVLRGVHGVPASELEGDAKELGRIFDESRLVPPPVRPETLLTSLAGIGAGDLESILEETKAMLAPSLLRGVSDKSGEIRSGGSRGTRDGGRNSRTAEGSDGASRIAPGVVLAHYRLVEPIGKGGMGVVWRAKDNTLGREVAIKILPSDADREPMRWARFEREAKLLASLSHPNIAVIHGLHEEAGMRFLAMELVPGRDLSFRLQRGPLPVDEALRVAGQIAEALEAAHRAGVIHRDLKPANVQLTPGGRVKLLDFGLAKAFGRGPLGDDSSHSPTLDAHLTDDGVILGTAAYMSPEQVRSEPLDERTDIWSFGCLLFECLCGRMVFSDPSKIVTLASILQREPAWEQLPSDLGSDLTRLLRNCLEKEPAQRSSSMSEVRSELAAALGRTSATRIAFPPSFPSYLDRIGLGPGRQAGRRRWISLAAAAAVVTAGLSFWVERQEPAPEPAVPPAARTSQASEAASKKRVVVLPFVNHTGQEALDAVGLMAADWVTQGLSRTRRLETVPTQLAVTSARQAEAEAGVPGGPSWIESVVRQTGAGTVVSGTYYLLGETLLVQAQISDAAEGTVLAALDPVEAPRSDPLLALEPLRQRVLGTIATFIDPELGSMASLVSHPPSFEAYEAFLAGMQHYTSMDFRGAIERLTQAAASDPDYATPRLMAASAHYNLGEYAQADAILAELRSRAESLAPLDRHNLEWLSAECRGDRPAALQAARRAAELSPRSHWTFRFGVVALMSNYPREARDAMVSLDPASGFVRGWVSFSYHYSSALHYLGEHEQELQETRRARQLSPESIGALGIEVRALAALGRVDELLTLIDDSVEFAPEWVETPGTTMTLAARELAAHGHRKLARELSARSIEWHQSLPASEATSRQHQENLLKVLFQADRLEEASEIASALAAVDPERTDYRGTLGVLAVRSGDHKAAADAEGWLRELDRPYLFGENLYWRAVMAAWDERPDEAVELLQQALARGRPFHWRSEQQLHLDPLLTPLWGTTGFTQLLTPNG